MSVTVCLAPRSTLTYPEAGGYLWIFLNWALGLRALDCDVVWLELAPPAMAAPALRDQVAALRRRLEPYGLARSVALAPFPGHDLPPDAGEDCLDLEAATQADLLLNVRCGMPGELVTRFRRSALLDIDPGLLQGWSANGRIKVAPHDVLFTVGERVSESRGRRWHHVPPCVALDWWRPAPPAADPAFTTVAHWHAGGWTGDEEAQEDKRAGFWPFIGLPARTALPLELALDLGEDDPDATALRKRGWRVRQAHTVAGTPWDYQRYVQSSLGELSCAKPAYVRLGNAWLSDRTPCFLASGKPAVVQYTGQSRLLPNGEGLFRFRDPAEAGACLERVATDYERQSGLAVALAEERFDARRAAGHVLEVALP